MCRYENVCPGVFVLTEHVYFDELLVRVPSIIFISQALSFSHFQRTGVKTTSDARYIACYNALQSLWVARLLEDECESLPTDLCALTASFLGA